RPRSRRTRPSLPTRRSSDLTDVDRRRDSQAICSSLFALGRGLGIKVLAEGVETAAEYLWLRRHGCRYFQGFYFSPPLESDRFTADRKSTRLNSSHVKISYAV